MVSVVPSDIAWPVVVSTRGSAGRDEVLGGAHQGERGASPDHRFYRGDRLLPEYRSRYVVDDWRGHQAGGIATGVIPCSSC